MYFGISVKHDHYIIIILWEELLFELINTYLTISLHYCCFWLSFVYFDLLNNIVFINWWWWWWSFYPSFSITFLIATVITIANIITVYDLFNFLRRQSDCFETLCWPMNDWVLILFFIHHLFYCCLCTNVVVVVIGFASSSVIAIVIIIALHYLVVVFFIDFAATVIEIFVIFTTIPFLKTIFAHVLAA